MTRTKLLLSAALFFAAPAFAGEIALDEVVITEGSEEAVVEHVPWSGSWWAFQSGRLAQGYHGPDNFTYDGTAQVFSEVDVAAEADLSPLRKYDLFMERREGTNPRSAHLELQGDDAKDFHHHLHGDRKQDFDDRGVSYSWWGHCNGWAAAAIMEREPVAPITAEGIRFEVGDLKGLLTESYWGVRSDFSGTRYNKPSDELKAKVERGQVLLDQLGGDDEPEVAEYITWYEDIYDTTLDDAVKANLTPDSFKSSLEHVRDWAKENWEDAYADLAPHVFHQLLVTQIKNKRSALVFDTSANEEVWNFPAYYYSTTLTKVEDLPDGGKRFEAQTTVYYAHDGVSESILGVNRLDMDYTYTLITDAAGHPTGGEWTGNSVDDHPDFAWVPTFNPTTEDRGENPRLLFGKLQLILQTDHEHGARQLELETLDADGNVVRQSQRIGAQATSTWEDPVIVVSPVTLRVGADAASGITRVVYSTGQINGGSSFATVDRGDLTLLGEVASSADFSGSFPLADGKHFVVAQGYDTNGRLISVSELTLDVGGTPPVPVTDDAYEENDDRAHAAPLAAGEHTGLWCRDEDWFRVSVPAGGTLKVEILFDASEGDLDLEVRDVGTSTGTSGTETVEGAALSAGDYDVKVYGYSGAQAAYTLKITVEGGATNPPPPPPPANDDAFEENDTRAQAAVLSAGTHALQVRDADWFAVELAAGEEATLTLTFTHADGDLDLIAHAPDGTRLDGSESTSDREEVRVVAATAGRYTFHVYGYDGAVNAASAVLAVQGSAPPPPPASNDDAFEANDTRDAATPIARGDHADLRAAGNDDWYSVELAANESITFSIDFSNAEGDLDITLHDAAGARVARSQTTGDRETVTYTATSAGRVYLRVYGYQGAQAAYSLDAQ